MGGRRRLGLGRWSKAKTIGFSTGSKNFGQRTRLAHRRPSTSSNSAIGKEAAPFVAAGGIAGVAGYQLTASDDEWTDVSDEDEDDSPCVMHVTAAAPAVGDGDDDADMDHVDASPEGQIGPLRFKELCVSVESSMKLSAILEKNKTLEWLAFHQTVLTDASVDSLCQFLQQNTSLKNLMFDTAVFNDLQLSQIFLALAGDTDMEQINITERIGDECIAQLCKYIGHRLPVTMRSVTPNEGEENRIEIAGRHGGGRMFIYMTTENGLKTFKRYK